MKKDFEQICLQIRYSLIDFTHRKLFYDFTSENDKPRQGNRKENDYLP